MIKGLGQIPGESHLPRVLAQPDQEVCPQECRGGPLPGRVLGAGSTREEEGCPRAVAAGKPAVLGILPSRQTLLIETGIPKAWNRRVRE